MKLLYLLLLATFLFFCLLLGLVGCAQRRLLYFPTHQDSTQVAASLGLIKWEIDGKYTGYARVLDNSPRVWLFMHGNAGQAGNRSYVLEHVAAGDSVYILEYPGYGERQGRPSRTSFDAAALDAYQWLVQKYGNERVIILGESLGSGPASQLAQAPQPPKHIVLVVPFGVLKDVAQENFRYLPVNLIMLDKWDNVAALKGFAGRLHIFGGKYDNVIPVHHARKLAASLPGAIYHEFEGGHNWANEDLIDLSRL